MSDLYDALAETEYGQTLQGEIRFGSFKPEWLPNEQWVEMLGPDVDNYQHMSHMAGLTEWFIGESRKLGHDISENDEYRLMVTAYVHDFAEAIDGDVPDPHKDLGAIALAKERESFITVASSVTNDAETLARLVMPIMHRQEPLGDVWRAIELIGYLETAFRANTVLRSLRDWQEYFGWTNRQMHEMDANLWELYSQVLERNGKELRQYRLMPAVAKYLRNLP